MKRAMDYGVEVLAYCPWSAVDLLSTSNGVKKRYGFIYVDRTDDDPKGMRPSAQGFLLLVSESDSVQGNGVGLRKQEEK